MYTLEKLNFLAENNDLMLEFVDFVHKINKKLCCDEGEPHLETWCDGACRALKFLKLIKDIFEENVRMEQKKFLLLCVL